MSEELDDAKKQLTAWKEASIRVSKRQSYTVNGRSITFANTAEIKDMITYWRSEVNRLTRGGIRVRRVKFID